MTAHYEDGPVQVEAGVSSPDFHHRPRGDCTNCLHPRDDHHESPPTVGSACIGTPHCPCTGFKEPTAAHYEDGPVQVFHGDCIDVMATLPPGSVDAVVCDPPYGLEFMGKDWDSFKRIPSGGAGINGTGYTDGGNRLNRPSFTGSPNPGCRNCGGFQRGTEGSTVRPCRCDAPDFPNVRRAQMHAFQAWCEDWAREAYRLLKPGGHLLAFGGTRTFHRLASGIEDAGFEIRDSIAWLYGSGFPKSLDVSKAIDRMAGAEREVVGRVNRAFRSQNREAEGTSVSGWVGESSQWTTVSAPATADAARWNGWGTALKPAFEPIVVARKPLTGTVAANVLAYGTGALNIDGSRIDTRGEPIWMHRSGNGSVVGLGTEDAMPRYQSGDAEKGDRGGRWPANVVLDASQAAALDTQSGVLTSGALKPYTATAGDRVLGHGLDSKERAKEYTAPADSGGASRFFKTVDTVAPRFLYTAKAGSDERPTIKGDGDKWLAGTLRKRCTICGKQEVNMPGSACVCPNPDFQPDPAMQGVISHPTVKPLDLMRWLVKLVTPPGGVVLEPFAGSGTTVEAAVLEGFRCIAIEREADYLPLILKRIRKPHAVGLDFGEWEA
jgi:DNA modification methylase